MAAFTKSIVVNLKFQREFGYVINQKVKNNFEIKSLNNKTTG